MNRFSTNTRCAIYIVLAAFCLLANDAIMKSLSQDVIWYQVLMMRSSMAFLFCLVLAVWIDGKRSMCQIRKDISHRTCILRVLLEALSAVLYLSALSYMAFIDATAISQLLPILLAIGGRVFFKERISRMVVFSIAFGLLGVMLIIKPGTEAFTPAAILAFCAIVSMAGRDLVTPVLPKDIPSTYINVFSMFGMWLVSIGIVLYGRGSLVLVDVWFVLQVFCAAVFVSLAFLFTIIGTRGGAVAFLAPFRYSSLLWGVIIGFIVFGEIPDWFTVVGALMVVGSGLTILYVEQQCKVLQVPKK